MTNTDESFNVLSTGEIYEFIRVINDDLSTPRASAKDRVVLHRLIAQARVALDARP